MINSGNKKLNFKITVFVVCLAIATFTWILIKLTGNFSDEISFPVTYKNAPENLILVNNVDSIIRIGLEEQGFVMARLKYFNGRSSFDIDLEKANIKKSGRGYIATVCTRDWATNITGTFNIQGEISYIRPDTIIFRFEDVDSKMVEVIPNINYTFQKQYYPYDSIIIEPAMAQINGLSSIVDTLDYLRTELMQFNNLNKTLKAEIKISNPLPGQISIDPLTVSITIPVEKFTESETYVPLSIINNTDNLRIKIFPDKIRVVFLVALKDFRKVNADMFSASIDLSEINTAYNTKIPVQIDTYPTFARIKKIDPPEVEYLILK
ncbi:MAG: hypothetical protein B6D64_05850 [Bacteroidetes bacterium 4484_276]|nr:MAG: hypothetical protein B6D64_05850 [Bacteroidetes bacterium 4484_276]